jgi:hypothetical protein
MSRLGIANTTRLAYFYMPHKVYPIRDTDSRLRKIVLNKNMLE